MRNASDCDGTGFARSSPAAQHRGGFMSEQTASSTIDHDFIRRWAEERGGKPSCVVGTGGKGDVGMIRIDFPGYSGEGSLKPISWDEFFQKFEESQLALLYLERTREGGLSNFNKLVSRTTAHGRVEPRRRNRPR